jgi:carbonic anhydrase
MVTKYIMIILIVIILFILIGLSIIIYNNPFLKNSEINLFLKEHTPEYIKDNKKKFKKAKAFVLTCIDFRLLNSYASFLQTNGYGESHDSFVLAGASLGVLQKIYPDWTSTFLEHIKLAKQLHNIEEIICIDHFDCGAYKQFYNKKTLSYNEEKKLHIENLILFKKIMNELFPELSTYIYLMDLDGSIEEIKK